MRFGEGSRLSRKIPSAWGLSMGGGIGGLLNLRQGGQNYAYLYDGKGNVTAILDGSQAVAATYTYDAFGTLMTQTGSLSQPFKFSTKLYDAETGLSYFGYRFYSSALGRWMTRDPVGIAGGMNLYGYVGNDAANLVDPFGLRTCKGKVRVIATQNPAKVNTPGGWDTFEQPLDVGARSASVIPSQWGGKAKLRPYIRQISGTGGPAGCECNSFGCASFNGITDVIGGERDKVTGENPRDKLQRLNPGVLILELPGAPRDLGTIEMTILVSAGLDCPTGTVEVR